MQRSTLLLELYTISYPLGRKLSIHKMVESNHEIDLEELITHAVIIDTVLLPGFRCHSIL
jgi:hypothetical protein